MNGPKGFVVRAIPSALHRASQAAARAVACPIPVPSPAKHIAQREDARFRVMRMIEAHPGYSQREIAQALGISLGAVNFCLNALVRAGSIKVRNFRAADNKLRYAYVLTPQGIAERGALMGRFLQRKLREYEALKAEIAALQATPNTPDESQT